MFSAVLILEKTAKSSFKDQNDIDKRCAEASRIRDKYLDRIPVIVEKSEMSDIPNIDKKKYQSNSLMLRYATLRSNELFHRLCTLYTRLFNAHWPHFKRLAESFELQAGYTDHKAYLAAVYVSSWFWDLYVSIRASVENISSTAVTEYFHTQQAHISERYDSFLAHLNSVIRPVHLKLALENTLWIPRICVRYQWTTGNPFQITNFTLNENLAEGIIELLDAKNKRFKLESLTSDTLGRPMWLLDWNADQAYAWFPSESNFTREDLVAPYILGIPCTPNLGPRDEDEWQFFPGGLMPAEIRMPARITNRKFYGSAEFRTCQTDWWDIPYTTVSGSSKRRQIEKSTSGGASTHNAAEPNELQITMPGTDQDTQMTPITIPVRVARFKVIDWCYYFRVVLALNAQTQDAAFRNFITKHD